MALPLLHCCMHRHSSRPSPHYLSLRPPPGSLACHSLTLIFILVGLGVLLACHKKVLPRLEKVRAARLLAPCLARLAPA